MPNKIEDLRGHLFATIEALRSEEKPMEIERAKAVAEVAKVIVDSAKVEVDMVRVTGRPAASGFLPQLEKPAPAAPPGTPRLVKGPAQP